MNNNIHQQNDNDNDNDNTNGKASKSNRNYLDCDHINNHKQFI